jgi:LysM repeat protein
MYYDYYDSYDALQVTPCPTGTTAYIIQPGDNFFRLAQRYGTTVAAIVAANPGVNPNRLMIGQRICIPMAPEVPVCPPGTVLYIVRAGDTLYSLAIRFGTTVAAIIAANPIIGQFPDILRVGQRLCIPTQPQFPACPEGNFYTIRAGDTLFAIARTFNVSLDDLLEANPGVDPTRLRVGQVICIPLATPPVECPSGSTTYIVVAGDTFTSIARRFNVTVAALIAANPGVNPNALLIGQRICIPRA